MAKKISKKTFTVFVVLAILFLVVFLFYSFYKKSNLFEGQTTNTTAPVSSPGKDESFYGIIKEAIDDLKKNFSHYSANSSNAPLKKLIEDTNKEFEKILTTAKTIDENEKKITQMITPGDSATQKTPQGTTASPSCTVGAANPPLVEYYPDGGNVMPEIDYGKPCPPPSGPVRWIRHAGNPGLCVVAGHTKARADCKQNVETWKNCVDGAARYNACITQPVETRRPLMDSCQPAYDSCVAAATSSEAATACRETYISCINPSTATPSASQPSTYAKAQPTPTSQAPTVTTQSAK